MSGNVKRSARVAVRLREELSAILRDMRDPRIVGTLISRVEMTDDLQTARVFVRRELGADTEADRRALIKGLASAAGKLRRDVSHALSLRYAPALHFFYDDAPDAMTRVEELLREIKTEEQGRGE
jgi:ribosome-binding factor A